MANLLATAVAVCPESKAWKQEEITFHISGFSPGKKKKHARKEIFFLTFASSTGIPLQLPEVNPEGGHT